MRQEIAICLVSSLLVGGFANEASAVTINLNSGSSIPGNAAYSVTGPVSAPVAFDTNGNVRPGGVYLPNSATSRWIGPTPTSGLSGAANAVPAGNYIYSASFNLTVFDIDDLEISDLLIASDNATTSVTLNGMPILPGPVVQNSPTFAAFTTLTPSLALFQAAFNNGGLNTLAFTVNNAGGSPSSSGFRTEFIVTAVPFEFSPMLGFGLLGAFVAWKRFKNAKNTLTTRTLS
jgi:hypothetical protein